MTAHERIALIGLAALGFLLPVGIPRLFAQDHHHPPQDAALHDAFYSTWYRPDLPGASCCNKQDCYPTTARFINGRWFARRREDGRWLSVPPAKVEINRDSPDGRSHLCAPRPDHDSSYQNGVICFIGGAAG